MARRGCRQIEAVYAPVAGVITGVAPGAVIVKVALAAALVEYPLATAIVFTIVVLLIVKRFTLSSQ